MQNKVINHKANRKRAALKNPLIFANQKSGDKVHGNGDSEKCFEPNTNYGGLLLILKGHWKQAKKKILACEL